MAVSLKKLPLPRPGPSLTVSGKLFELKYEEHYIDGKKLPCVQQVVAPSLSAAIDMLEQARVGAEYDGCVVKEIAVMNAQLLATLERCILA